ncbi:hypothetical protein HPB48_026103 [Haemaphysalis longicornis]|uniref:Uncharacterized protein n=1 Tax=Haemaphysalis longicornis TaxID=44386 RepID=A0A9J6HBJ6_HAELO|nr:hypothetical protein HPB48_026103 [Haemaphysalis longicornis]
MIRDLIEVMTSRYPDKALRPGSVAEDKLIACLAYLAEWELHVGKEGGFLSQSTAVGLRVSISSVLCLLDDLTKRLKFKYIMTSKLSQESRGASFWNNKAVIWVQFVSNATAVFDNYQLPELLWPCKVRFE